MFKKENKFGGQRLPDFKTYYKTTVIKKCLGLAERQTYFFLVQHREMRNNHFLTRLPRPHLGLWTLQPSHLFHCPYRQPLLATPRPQRYTRCMLQHIQGREHTAPGNIWLGNSQEGGRGDGHTLQPHRLPAPFWQKGLGENQSRVDQSLTPRAVSPYAWGYQKFRPQGPTSAFLSGHVSC